MVRQTKWSITRKGVVRWSPIVVLADGTVGDGSDAYDSVDVSLSSRWFDRGNGHRQDDRRRSRRTTFFGLFSSGADSAARDDQGDRVCSRQAGCG